MGWSTTEGTGVSMAGAGVGVGAPGGCPLVEGWAVVTWVCSVGVTAITGGLLPVSCNIQ